MADLWHFETGDLQVRKATFATVSGRTAKSGTNPPFLAALLNDGFRRMTCRSVSRQSRQSVRLQAGVFDLHEIGQFAARRGLLSLNAAGGQQ
jgi:hypothetical protein